MYKELIDSIINDFFKVADNLKNYQSDRNKDNMRLYEEIFRAESACIRLRKLPYYCNFNNKKNNIQKNLDSELLKAHEIFVGKNKGNLDFIRYPLQVALNKYVEKNGYPDKEREKRILIIRHGYPNNSPEYHCRDHDNYEVKGIIDDIASYFLVDDSIIYCDRLYLSKADNDFYTEIIIIPSKDLPKWICNNF